MFFPIPAFRSFRQWMDTSSAFVRAWVRSPRSVGMVCPSGMPLARSMAAFAPRKGDGLVVELGAGTGTVTRQLLDAGIAPRRLVVVEQSPVMVSLLRERFPQLAILEADARWLADCLPRDRQVDCIVSSLPLLSLNERVRNQIISAMFEVLHEGGLLIQYTYSWRKANAFLKDGFRCIGSSQVWHNEYWGVEGGPFSRKGLPPLPKPHPSHPKDFRVYRIPLVSVPCWSDADVGAFWVLCRETSFRGYIFSCVVFFICKNNIIDRHMCSGKLRTGIR